MRRWRSADGKPLVEGKDVTGFTNSEEEAVDAILRAARTRKIGDGIIFVLWIDQAVRIRTKERGEEAL
jgi:nitrogen regulatory protein P-II 1